ncbi:hypothetical protein F0562_017124 [Nyssa sinensis]|uniref:Uncharacterized protein n=1 Tax=Nyssa sinensis TaxID=561372 RepID=A0A5J4ZHP3_9ASTE|nr:hypothetical protein F0562_017124 [Nyssa sinensis]
MAHKKVGGKNKPKDAASKKETDKGSDSSGGRVLRSRTVTKGGRNIHEHAKSKKPMAEEGNLRIDSGVQKGKNAGKRKVTTEEENVEMAKTPAKGIRHADKNEKEKSNLDGTERVLRSRNVRIGNGNVDEKSKGKKSEEENAGKIRAPGKRRNAGQEIAEANVSPGEGSYNLRANRGVPSFRKVDLSESGFVQVVGKRVKVFQFGLRKWITGKIESYDGKQKLHKVLCDDGDLKEMELKTQRFMLEVLPGEAFTLSSKHKLNVKKKQTDSYGGSVDAESMKKGSLGVGDAGPVEKLSKPTRKVATRAAKRRDSKLPQKENIVDEKVKRQKGKKIISKEGSDDQSLDMEEIDEEMDSDGDLVLADIVKKPSQKVGNAGPEKKLPKQKASKKTVSKGLSAAQTRALQRNKKDGGQLNVERRKNPARGRENSKTK